MSQAAARTASTISPPPSVRKIGLRIQRCTAAHARCADRLTISTIHAIACSKDAWRTGHRAGTLHHDISIIVTVHNTGRKISGWRMTDSHEYGVGVQRAFFSGHHITYGDAADTGRCYSRSFERQAGMAIGAPVFCVGEEVPVMEVTTVLVIRVMVGLALARSTMICEARKLSRR